MKTGFSLIELIAVLLLVGVLAASATISLLPVAEGLAQVRRNATTMQKSRLALARLTREFTTITNLISGGARTMVYDFLDLAGTPRQHTLSWSGVAGESLMLEGVPLTDDVADFELRYYDYPGTAAQAAWTTNSRLVEIVLESLETGDRLTNRIAPRNLLFRGEVP